MRYSAIIAGLLLLIGCGPHRSGAPGLQGPPGLPGTPGQGCSIQAVNGGAIVTCGPDQVLILDGAAGPQGPQGPTGPVGPYNVAQIIDPCGDGPGHDEILFVLGNGQIVAHYSSGPLQFLTVLSPGNYVTTDQQACNFTLTLEGTIED